VIKRSWVEIDLKKLVNNSRIYRNQLFEGQDIMAIVKADAYNHGDARVALRLQADGICHFAVSNITEAINLRNVGIAGEILILGYTPVDQAHILYDRDITQTMLDEDYAEKMAKTGLRLKAEFAIDTGMNRIGLDGDDPDYCEAVIRKYADFFDLTGVFTHMSVADEETEENREFTLTQIRKFKEITGRLSDLYLDHLHFMNSASGLWYNNKDRSVANMVRLGIVMYGLKPNYDRVLPEGVEPALSWKSVIAQIKTIHKGESVGYGRKYIADKETVIAVIPTGYADGYLREYGYGSYVLINGKKANILGNICMDQMMVDVTDIPDAAPETEVVLIGTSGDLTITADDIANRAGTIGYQIICGLNKRVERVYIE